MVSVNTHCPNSSKPKSTVTDSLYGRKRASTGKSRHTDRDFYRTGTASHFIRPVLSVTLPLSLPFPYDRVHS